METPDVSPEARLAIIRSAFEPELARSPDPVLIRELFAYADQYYRRMMQKEEKPADSLKAA